MIQKYKYYSSAYRFGFNGQEKDNEIKGEGNSLNFKFRMYDSRIARFFAVDPLTSKYPYWTPYQFAGLMPIWARELEGLEPLIETLHLTQPSGFTSKGLLNYQKNMTSISLHTVKYGAIAMTIVGGCVAVVASGGSATPAVVTAYNIISGSLAFAGGSASLVANIKNDINSTENSRNAVNAIPESPLSFVALTIDVISGDKNYTLKGTVDLVEGVYQFKPSKESKDVLNTIGKTITDVNTIIGASEYVKTLDKAFDSKEQIDYDKSNSSSDNNNNNDNKFKSGTESTQFSKP